MKTNAKHSSPDQSADKARIEATTAASEEGGSNPSSEMNDQELAAFNAIMNEIEGQAGPTERADDNDASSDGESEPVGDGDADGKALSSGSSQGPSSREADELDAEQQKAFESIMAQIEGGNGQHAADDAAAETDDSDDAGDADDFAAELEKVARQAATQDPTGTPSESSTDDLDLEQRKAFESIMAQIESGNGQPATDDADTIAPENDASRADDDFSGELEKVVKTADAEGRVPSEGEPSDDELDEDQQKAFESIMAQIEGGGKDRADAEPDTDNALQHPEVEHDPASEPSPRPSVEGSDEDALPEEGEVDDIERILQEIALEDQEPPTTDSTSEQATKDSNDEGPPGPPTSVDVTPVRKRDATARNPASAPSHRALANAEEASVDPLTGADVEPDAAAAQEPDPKSTPTPSATVALREAGRPAEKKRSRTLIAPVVFGVLLALAASVYWPRSTVDRSTPSRTSTSDRHQTGAVDTQPAAPIQPHEPQLPVQAPSDRSRLTALIERLDRLRNQLNDKRSEIEELRDYYQAGIDAEIDGIVQAVVQSGRPDFSFNHAMADTHISLGLAAIQRRDLYIRKLLGPMNTLLQGSEELLYLSKKAELLSIMVEKTSDIDVDGYTSHAAAIMDRHANTLASLDIDGVPATPIELASLWQDIVKHIPNQATKKAKDANRHGSDDTILARRICEGEFTDKHQLTALSPETARCLARWKGKDLFLNALTELRPEAARYLADWQGDWLGLNGLRELSPEAAVHLARWKGKGLSLNGLQRLSPRVVAILSEWEGDQIELVNVKHMAHWENPRTKLLLSEALKRKIRTARK